MQSSAGHGVASSVACKSLHAVIQFSSVQHEVRAPPTRADGLFLGRRIVSSALEIREACGTRGRA